MVRRYLLFCCTRYARKTRERARAARTRFVGKGLTLGAWVLRSGPKAILLHYNTSLSLRLRYTRAISRAYSTIYACKNFLAKNKIHRADFGQVKHTEVDSDAK